MGFETVSTYSEEEKSTLVVVVVVVVERRGGMGELVVDRFALSCISIFFVSHRYITLSRS